jgi:hypothetical protein
MIYITEMLRWGDDESHHYIIGAYSTNEEASYAGEFREDLNKIKHLAYNFDSDGVIDAIRTLENKMFEV